MVAWQLLQQAGLQKNPQEQGLATPPSHDSAWDNHDKYNMHPKEAQKLAGPSTALKQIQTKQRWQYHLVQCSLQIYN